MKLKEHRELLLAAIRRNEDTLTRMGEESGTDCPCCFGAAYGGTNGPYCKLERKLERQYEWLTIIDNKIKAARNNGL